ncbi:MAG: potassium/proton antiporter [Deferribacteraceae bacterium]|jgi:cell volume regulation protein A|nr:potassium/proton antiporter [Deferribacteraceae bacterium]
MPEFSIELVLLVLSFLFLVSVMISNASSRFGVPVLLLFLGVGMFFGSDGIGIKFDNMLVAQAIGTFALCIILFSGGLDTKVDDIRPIYKAGISLATVGVLLTALLTGGFIWLAGGLLFPDANITLPMAILLASIMSSTDSASVFGILRTKGISLKNNIQPLLEMESGSNDPVAYMLIITFIQIISTPESATVLGTIASMTSQLAIGAVAGYVLGKVAVKLMNWLELSNNSLYPVLLFTCCIFIFSVTAFIKGNGYLAIYIGGLVIGNSKFYTKRTSVRFFDGLAWLSQVTMFLALGLLVNPSELIKVIVPCVLISLFMLLVGRPVSVFVSTLPFNFTFKQKLYISWVGLRGAVPIVFAILPMVDGVPNAQLMFNVVFFITLISLLLQGSTITIVADLLGVSGEPVNKEQLKEFDMEFSDDIKSSMTEITLTDEILERGNKLINMGMPDKALVAMVKRSGKYFIPRGNTELAAKDVMLVIADSPEAIKETYKVLGLKRRY